MRWGRAPAGAAAVAGALLAAAATLLLPWLAIPGAASGASPSPWPWCSPASPCWLALVQRGGNPYERELFWLPLAAAALVLACGLALLVGARRGRSASRLDRAACAGVALGGFWLLLCGTRWLGFYVARLMDSGPTLAHLHAAPWIVLADGALVAAAGLAALDPPGLSRKASPARWVAAAAATALASLPIFPVAVRAGGHFDELTVSALLVASAAGAAGAPEAAGLPALLALPALRWVLALLLAFACLVALVGRPALRPALRVATLAGAGLATGAAALFYWKVSLLGEGMRPWPNPVLPLVGPGLLALGLWRPVWRAPASPAAQGRGRPVIAAGRTVAAKPPVSK